MQRGDTAAAEAVFEQGLLAPHPHGRSLVLNNLGTMRNEAGEMSQKPDAALVRKVPRTWIWSYLLLRRSEGIEEDVPDVKEFISE